MDNKEIRRKLLETLYEYEKEQPSEPMHISEIQKLLEIDAKKIDLNLSYLDQKGYIYLGSEMGTAIHYKSRYGNARITADGTDLIEDPEEFNSLFPLTVNVIHESPGSTIVSGTQINVNNSFNTIYDELGKKDIENKEEIEKNVKIIESELKKSNPDKTTIDTATKFLKENASWIMPSLLEILKATFGF